MPALLLLVPHGALAAAPTVPGSSCPVFPADNIWNTDISSLPVNAHSAAWLASSGATGGTLLHPDFGAPPYGIPFNVVGSSHATTNFTFEYPDESDAGAYPYGSDLLREGPTDSHQLSINSDTCRLYETWATDYNGPSTAGSGAIFDLTSNALRPAGWTSADAAGLPIMPRLVRRDEVQAGAINHAIRFTVAQTDTSYLWPARHQAGARSDPTLPPMGARFRLQAGYDVSGYGPEARVVLTAMKRYGLIVADNGSNWFFQGTMDAGWGSGPYPQMIADLKRVPAAAFEAVDESSLMISPDSAQARQPGPAAPPPAGGYNILTGFGGIYSFGNAGYYGNLIDRGYPGPAIGLAETPDGLGYDILNTAGAIYTFGDAQYHGNLLDHGYPSPAVAIAVTPSGGGYAILNSSGALYTFGDAPYFGNLLDHGFPGPAVSFAYTPSGRGYSILTASGAIYSFGDAVYYGNLLDHGYPGPATGLAPSPHGYAILTQAGAIYTFGDAYYRGNLLDHGYPGPAVAISATS
ncbi:MAG TPA: hypothetical protein VF160_03305 [Candidatus Dormibacteraeota bacterium]